MRKIDCCQLFWLAILAIGGALPGLIVDITIHEGNSCKYKLINLKTKIYREVNLER